MKHAKSNETVAVHAADSASELNDDNREVENKHRKLK
jgi:hypothetical protein